VSQGFLDLIKRGDTQRIADWVKDEPQIAESRDAQGVSALLLAVYNGQTVIRDFLRSGLELDLPEAAAVGDVPRLQELLGDDAKLAAQRANGRSADGWPLLHLAAYAGHLGCVEVLIERGYDIHQRDRVDNATALHCAAAGGHLAIVKRLVALGGRKGRVVEERGEYFVNMFDPEGNEFDVQ